MNEIVKYCAEAKVTVIHNFDFDFDCLGKLRLLVGRPVAPKLHVNLS